MPAHLPIAESLCQSPSGDACVTFDVGIDYHDFACFRLNPRIIGRAVDGPESPREPNVPQAPSSGKRLVIIFISLFSDSVARLGLVVVHARDIRGNILRSFDALPSTTERVPSLGALADELLDAFGYLESAVITFRDAYFAAQVTGSDPRVHFVQTLAEHGMAQKEASIWFTILQSSIADSGNTSLGIRYRPSLESK